MRNIILWGTGKIANKLIKLIDENVLLVVDNDEKKWGTIWNGYIVSKPNRILDSDIDFDKVIIAAYDWKMIREQLIKELFIRPDLIDNMYYRQREEMLKKYIGSDEDDIQKNIVYLNTNPLEVFNDVFTHKYLKYDIDVFRDDNSFFFVYHNNKKMYFSKKYDTVEKVKKYYRALLMEQDINSPHRYQVSDFHVNEGDIVLDAGVAEGNFALDVIDLVEKIYLIEPDADWIEALKCTFEPFRHKVKIVKKFLGSSARGKITIDELINNGRINFIKMDIEGAEVEALNGAKQVLLKNNVKLDICSYHNGNDEKMIKELLTNWGYQAKTSTGYMVFITDHFLEEEVVCPQFVRGLVRGYKC